MNQLPTKVIKVGDEVLFYRAFLAKIFGWTIYLHHYMMSDPDRGLHNHPFRAYALVLAGGYFEDRLLGLDEKGLTIKTRWLNPGSINKIDQYCFHRLMLNEGKTSWSLFFCRYLPGKTWGFLESDELDRKAYKAFFFRREIHQSDRFWYKSALKGKKVCQN